MTAAQQDTWVIGTFDTKSRELTYVADLIRATGLTVRTVDVSTSAAGGEDRADISPAAVAAAHPDGADAVFTGDRGSSVTAMSVALGAYLAAHRGEIAGAIGLGGSGNTALVSGALQLLPVGLPKVMVSTVASGNVAPYVGSSDLTMVHSVTDVAGLNRISRVVLGNAAHALAGMVSSEVPAAQDLPSIALSMFGVTTPCVTSLVAALEDRYDCLVFHATGSGGRSMEKLVDDGLITAVMDMTTTEICDEIAGGALSAGPDRMDSIARSAVPYVGSCGALDMVNFGARETVPDRFADRNLFVHNAQVTLMRTTAQECRQIGEFIARKLNACSGPVRFLLPTGGVSMLDAPGQPFHDPDADEVLFSAIEELVEQTADRQVVRVPFHINDDGFVAAALQALDDVLARPAGS